MFEPFLQAVAMGREENHVRTAATSTEPPEKHMRLTEPQMEELVDEFHAWRDQGQARRDTSRRMVETFLHYVSSGGYYRQVGFALGRATSTIFADLQQVASFFMDIAPQHISLPGPGEFDELAQDLEDVEGQCVLLWSQWKKLRFLKRPIRCR